MRIKVRKIKRNEIKLNWNKIELEELKLISFTKILHLFY